MRHRADHTSTPVDLRTLSLLQEPCLGLFCLRAGFIWVPQPQCAARDKVAFVAGRVDLDMTFKRLDKKHRLLWAEADLPAIDSEKLQLS